MVRKCTFLKGTTPVTAFVPFFSESVCFSRCVKVKNKIKNHVHKKEQGVLMMYFMSLNIT